MTKFLVLAKNKGEQLSGWAEHSEQEAHSAEAAIKAAYMKNSKDVLAMVAVPVRSWKPQAIRTETTERVVLGSPDDPPPDQEAMGDHPEAQ